MEAVKDISGYDWENADWLNNKQKDICREYHKKYLEAEQLKKQKDNVNSGNNEELFNEETVSSPPVSSSPPVNNSDNNGNSSNEPGSPTNSNSSPNQQNDNDDNKDTRIKVSTFDEYLDKIFRTYEAKDIIFVESDGIYHIFSDEEKELLKTIEEIKSGKEVNVDNLNINEEYKQKLRNFQKQKQQNNVGEPNTEVTNSSI